MNSVVLHKKTHDLLRATKRRYAFFDHEARAENGHLMRPDPEPQKKICPWSIFQDFGGFFSLYGMDMKTPFHFDDPRILPISEV